MTWQLVIFGILPLSIMTGFITGYLLGCWLYGRYW